VRLSSNSDSLDNVAILNAINISSLNRKVHYMNMENNSIYHLLSNTVRLFLLATLVIVLTLGTGQMALAAAGPAPVDLGAAAPFVILTKTGITNVPASDITGNLGVSPIDSTAITGLPLVADSTNTFSRSTQVTGKIYAADYASPTPANLTTAVSNMEGAYTDAAGRSLPDFTELYSGNLSGRTLVPGLYKWSTGVSIDAANNVTLAGDSNAVWIFQISGDLTLGSGAKVLLSGGAQANNIFWQVAGGAGATIGTTAHFEGTLLAKTAIHLQTGASLNGRALAQTAVTLDHNTIVISGVIPRNFLPFIHR
jgi:Ice-binding-like